MSHQKESTWVQATPEEMIRYNERKLANTPRWKFLSRLQTKRVIRYWKEQL